MQHCARSRCSLLLGEGREDGSWPHKVEMLVAVGQGPRGWQLATQGQDARFCQARAQQDGSWPHTEAAGQKAGVDKEALPHGDVHGAVNPLP